MRNWKLLFLLSLALIGSLCANEVAQAAWSKTYFKTYTKHKIKLKEATGVPKGRIHKYRLEGSIAIWEDKIVKNKPFIGKTKTSIKWRKERHTGYAHITATWDGKTFKEEIILSRGLKGKVTNHIQCKSDPYLSSKVKGTYILHGNTTGHIIFTDETQKKRRPYMFVDAGLATGLSLQASKKPGKKPAKKPGKRKKKKKLFSGIRAPKPGKKPSGVKSFKLSFPEFAMTLIPSKRSVQFSVKGTVVSYGRDWEVRVFSPSKFHLRQKNWKGFFWSYDGRKGYVEKVIKGTFGRFGRGKHFKLASKAKKVGGGNTIVTFPRATKPYLICSAAQKGKPVQIIVQGMVISYGGDWIVSRTSGKTYLAKVRTWKGFSWRIDCARKRAYQVRNNKPMMLPFGVTVH